VSLRDYVSADRVFLPGTVLFCASAELA